MRTRFQCLFVACVLFLLLIPAANAQSFDANIGFGAAQAGTASTGLDSATLMSCSLSSDQNCVKRSGLSNFMMGFGGTVMVFEKLGVSGEVNLQPAKLDYATLSMVSPGQFGEKIQARNTLYDFNAVYRPVSTKRALLQLEGGIGGMNVKFYDTLSSSSSLLGNSNSSSNLGSVNKFQLHGGIGVQIYLKDNLFIRPQFDLHYVPNLDRYGSNLVKRETIWVGYTFGR